MQFDVPWIAKKKTVLIGPKRFAVMLSALMLFHCAFFFFLFCPVLDTPLLNRLSSWPDKCEYWTAGKELNGIPCEQMSFPVRVGAKSRRLSGVFYKHPKAKDVVLISHGNGGSLRLLHRMDQIAYMLFLEHSVFVYDYEGFGISEGEASYHAFGRDGVAAFDFVQQKLGFKPGQIILYGLSMGTGVSCEIARVRSPKGIILDSAYTSAEAAAKHIYPLLSFYPSYFFPEPRYDNLSYLRGKHPPVLVLTPLNDGTVPPDHGMLMAKQGSPSLTFVPLPNSPHAGVGIGDEKLYQESLKTFFNRCDHNMTDHNITGAGG